MNDNNTAVESTRRSAAILITGAAATVLSGLLVQAVILPASTISDDRWTYPWSSTAQIPVSIVYSVLHLLVIVGLVGLSRRGVTGVSRSGRVGLQLAIGGTALLLIGELASIVIRHADVHDTSAGIVGGIYALGTIVSAIGFLLAGVATARSGRWQGWRRWTLLATGIWLVALVPLTATDALATGVAVYGLCLLAIGVALYTEPVPVAVPVRAGLVTT